MSAEAVHPVPTSAGLPPRPGPSPEILAILTAAVDAAWPRPIAAPAPETRGVHQSWRFSGRWWAQPMPLRRNRPSSAGR